MTTRVNTLSHFHLHAFPYLVLLSLTDVALGEPISLSDAVIGLQAYKEVDERTKTLWHDIDHAVVGPRMDLASNTVSSIQIQNVSHSLMPRRTRNDGAKPND